MRIAICIPELGRGGAQRTVLGTARGLIARGHEVDLLLFRPLIRYPGEIPAAARLFVPDTCPDDETRTTPAGDPLQRRIALAPEVRAAPRLKSWIRLAGALKGNLSALPGRRWLKEMRFVASYVSSEKPDCVLPSLPRSKVAALWAMDLLPEFPPVIPTVRNALSHRNRTARIRYRRLLGRSAHVVAVSDGIRDEVLTFAGLPPDRVSTIYNPVTTPELDELRRAPPDHPWMTDGGPPVVLAAGRLKKHKDHATLLRAFQVLARNRDLRLIVLGEGERQRRLEERVRALGLADKVSLPGWVDNPFAFMARAALFVLSSRHEGLPSVLIQALACGCPVVSTDCPSGPSEILEGGRIGPLVPVGDHAALADAMERVLDHPPDREMLMRRAAFFSADRAVDAYERLIAETVTRHRTRAASVRVEAPGVA